jgi:predicted lipoprotein with Yx(FWY)xxD motif
MMHSNLFLSHTLTRSCFGMLVGTALVVILAACGSNTSSYGSGSSTPAANSSSSIIKTATATVSGKAETILIDAQGMTLYYRTSDAPPATVCSAGCVSIWPPFIISGSGAPTSTASLPGTLTTVKDANGNQVEYNGHPLYTFSGDTAPGQTTGNGTMGIWFVATPNLKSQRTQPAPVPTPSNGYSGGY